MFLKLGMRHQGEELYKVYINHDPGMTLTYFMARSAEVSYPRSQVSVYRTIGPLVIIVMKYSYKTDQDRICNIDDKCESMAGSRF